jgi:hypothetical protein
MTHEEGRAINVNNNKIPTMVSNTVGGAVMNRISMINMTTAKKAMSVHQYRIMNFFIPQR